eukprot:CAMPEP_0118948894 /NCGR_PEP_ID=MMETSP1169-20130426/48645_1 /TAXON_ID=36882 /ORGANISM="Pyramimonas obovata, Strain CCMP722" /LENGTH=141 /DNA_ID=CAMNT_0006895417 /DNA_START=200 /DNA_END=621 /DNA_ORIENTATION=+
MIRTASRLALHTARLGEERAHFFGTRARVPLARLGDHGNRYSSPRLQTVRYSSASDGSIDVSSTPTATTPSPLLSVAPMMDWTDTHYRHLARLLSRHTWLYTEMVVDKTLIHNPDNLERWLEFSAHQNPVVLQLGGSDPET